MLFLKKVASFGRKNKTFNIFVYWGIRINI